MTKYYATITGKNKQITVGEYSAADLAESVKDATIQVFHGEDPVVVYNTVEIQRGSNDTKPTAARYLEQVEQADSLDELDTITETAANDDTISTAEYERIHAAALRKAQGWDPQNKRQEDTATKSPYTAETYQDNAGRLHLAVLDHTGECVYYLTDADATLVMDTLAALIKGGDPVADQWEGGEPDPATAYKWIIQTVEARNGGAWEIDAVQAMRGGAKG